jgi:hypothetical protein
MRRRTAVVVASAVLLLTSRAALADDVVLLKGGGRLRGTVIEETKKDVRIKLLDGTVRELKPEEVERIDYEGQAAPAVSGAPSAAAPAASEPGAPSPLAPPTPPPAVIAPSNDGHLIIKADEPGAVYIDDAQRGVIPLDVPRLPQGTHEVKVVFDGGGSWSRDVSVMPDQTTELTAAPSAAGKAFHFRRGIHFGGTIGPSVTVGKLQGVALRLSPFVNFGLSPAIDIRVGPVLGLGNEDGGHGDPGFAFHLGIAGSFRLNLGSLYTLWIGVEGGVYDMPGVSYNESTGSYDGEAVPYVMGTFSPLTFRFGSHREFEAGYAIGALAYKRSDSHDPKAAAQNMLEFTYLVPWL